MKKLSYILPIIILFVFQSCKKKTKENTKITLQKKENISSKEKLEKYISTYYIPYLLKEDIDSILVNEERIKNDKKYRNKFITKAIKRRGGIGNLRRTLLNNQNKIPSLLKKYLLPNELSKFNKDSITEFIILYELMKKRIDTMNMFLGHHYKLSDDEIQKLIQGSFKDSIFYKKWLIIVIQKIVLNLL